MRCDSFIVTPHRLMTWMTLGLLCCAGGIAAEENGMTAEEHRASVLEWRQGRIDRLLADTGYLTLAGMFWLDEGLPPRAQQFFDALSGAFGTRLTAACLDFQPEELL